MVKHFVWRMLPTLALAVSVVGCGALERKTEPTLASAAAGNTTAGTSASASPSREVRSDATLIDRSEDASQGIRFADHRHRLNLNVFGISYHPNRQGIRNSHLDNEFNPGLGLNYEFHNDARGVGTVDVGFLKDSGRNWAKFAGVGYQFKLGDNWRLGADLLAIHSNTYNKGRGFIAPVPHLSYDFGHLKLNAIYVPSVPEYVQFSAFSFFITVPMGAW